MVDLTGYKLTFDDEFNTLSVSQNGTGTTWSDIRSGSRLNANADIGFGSSAFVDAASGINPFSIQNGALDIAAVHAPSSIVGPGQYASGLLTTEHTFSQEYGYFEMRAQLPQGAGVWPAFWMLPTNGSTPTELDVLEAYGSSALYNYIHTSTTSAYNGYYSNQPAMTSGYHTYGVQWNASTITFYFDGTALATLATPSDMHSAMYMLLDLAMVSGSTVNSADMQVDYVRAYSSDATATAVSLGGISSPDGVDTSDLHGAVSLVAATTAVSNATAFGSFIHDPASAGGEVYALYEGLLGRAPDPLGFEDFTHQLQSGLSLHDLAQTILSSAEHTAHYGAYNQLSDAAFVTQLYQVVQGRAPDAPGLTHWEQALASGVSRVDVAVSFALSAEHIGSLQPSYTAGIYDPDKGAADVARLYYGIQGRAPDGGGLAHFVTALAGGESVQDVAKDFLGSAEYQSKFGGLTDSQFVDTLYQNALGRHAEADGLNHFVLALQHGSSRADVAYDIVESPEAHQHLLPVIEQGWVLA